MRRPDLSDRPRTDHAPIEDVVRWISAGRVRVPSFQRPLRWGARQVHELFDSIARGFPIGSVLMWEKAGPGETVRLGNQRIECPEMDRAWYVVDGQQRLTALYNVLRHPGVRRGAADPFALWYDLEDREFVRPDPGDDRQHLLPMNRVLDATDLALWWEEYPLRGTRPSDYRTALELGKAVREFRLPYYLVGEGDERALRVIFARMNSSGVAMRESEVFAALHTESEATHSLHTLSERVRDSRAGSIPPAWLVRCVRAVRGDDLTRPPVRELDAYADAMVPTLRAIETAVGLLVDAFDVPHLSLVPYRLPLVVLARFLHLHPDPSPRSRMLLKRWFWRGMFTERHRDTQNPHLRWITTAIQGSEDAVVQEMLRDARSPSQAQLETWELPKSWRFSSAATKLAGTVLASTGPRSLRTGDRLEVASLLEEVGSDAFRALPGDRGGPEGRILHGHDDDLLPLLAGAGSDVLRSHLLPALPDDWVEAVREWDLDGRESDPPVIPESWFTERRQMMSHSARDLFLGLCGTGLPDHAGIASALREVSEA